MKTQTLPALPFSNLMAPVLGSKTDGYNDHEPDRAQTPRDNWRQKYGVLCPSDAIRLCELEKENIMLKRVIATLSLQIAVAVQSDGQ